MDRYFYLFEQRKERDQMRKGAFDDELVECHYNGAIHHIPVKIFFSMLMRSQIDEKKFIRYKEGAYLYSMSEREFNKLAHDANAIYKRNKMVLVKMDIVDKYLEYFRVQD